ncbi:toxin-antitoxin system, antitoxin component, Xre family protein [Microcoleus sp. A003_D6]|uniref:toxin-antitoxin system, antitoxin component, Xre family protein n=1 Tax=Microcoleus sp. A003_D6 TaxID=3055266 RepID=UPI002FD6CB42
MSIAKSTQTKLIEKIRSLPPDKITVLEDFLDFLLTRSEDSLLTYSATKISEAAFARIWDNPEDAEYDEL